MYRIILVILGVALMSPASASADFRSFTESDGLPSRFLTDFGWHGGRLLIGSSDGGFAQFDGIEFIVRDTSNGLPVETDDVVMGFLERSDGSVLIACFGGVVHWDGADSFSLDGPPWRNDNAYNVTSAVEEADGTLWIATTQGVARKSAGVWEWIDSVPNVVVMSIHLAVDGSIWAGTQFDGAFRFDGLSWSRFGNGVGFQSRWVSSISEDSQGHVWLSTPRGAARYDGSTWRTFTIADGLAGDSVLDVVEDSRGNLWFAISSFGITRWDGTSWKSFGEADGVLHQTVNKLYEDPRGALWISTGQGASRYDYSGWDHFTVADGLAGSSTYGMVEDSSGDLWVGGLNGASRWDGSSWSTQSIVPIPPGSTAEAVLDITQDSAGRMWFTTNNGIAMLVGTFWLYVRTEDGLASNEVWDVFEDSRGRIWFATTDGVSRLEPDIGVWVHYTQTDGLPDGWQFTDIAEDHSGRIWVAGELALARWSEAAGWEEVPIDAEGANAVEVAPNGDVWVVGSRGGGLFHFDGTSWTNMTSDDGLLTNFLNDILFDDSGALWITSGSGLNRLKDGVLGAYTAGDGELPVSSLGALYQSPGGTLWIAGSGLTAHEVDRLPPVSVPLGTPPAASASRLHTITWDVGFKDAAGTLFQTSFDGGFWSQPKSTRSWTMDGISDGAHELQIRAIDRIGNVEREPASVRFTIDGTPPLPTLSSPAFGEAVSGSVQILGSASDSRFVRYVVDVRPVRAETWTQLADRTEPVEDALLATWDTADFEEGEHELRLSIDDDVGMTGRAVLRVLVDNAPPFNEVTSPVRVTPRGGEVFSLLGEARVYFPPGAFEVETIVRIESPAPGEVPAQLPDGASRLWEGMRISWDGPDPVKSGTLEFFRSDLASEPSVYALRGAGSWEYLGGTRDGGHVSLPIAEPGLHALFAGGSGETILAPGLSRISLTPRVLDLGNPSVAVSFSVSRDGPVSVTVFNRAGRLVKRVVGGTSFPPGFHAVRWDGRNESGALVGNGLYLVSVEAMDQRETKTLSVVR